MGKASMKKKKRRLDGYTRKGSRLPLKYNIYSLEYREPSDDENEHDEQMDTHDGTVEPLPEPQP